jgi:hypothetical protein
MPAAPKLDLYKLHKSEYVAPKAPVLVMTLPAKYLAIGGQGKPGSKEFQADTGALYGMAYTLKMAAKARGQDYKVSNLEGIYWGAGPEPDVPGAIPTVMNWLLIIRVPDFIQPKDLGAARDQLRAKGKTGEFDKVKLERIDEGACVQMLHVGSYQDEPKTVAQMSAFAKEKGLTYRGRHHEIYLSDPRRVPPARLKTILRLPVSA